MHINARSLHTIWKIAVLSILPLLSFCTNAASKIDSLYLGVKASWIAASSACEDHVIDCDNKSAGGGLFVGYMLNDWLAVEAGYDYLGKIKAIYPAIGFPVQTASYKSEVQGLAFVAKPYWKIRENLSLFGKAGTMFWNMDVTGDEVDFTHYADDRDWSPLLGAGIECVFNSSWSTTLEYQWINNVGGSDTGGVDINAINLGIIYHFTYH